MGSEGRAVHISHSLNDFINGKSGLREHGASVLNADVLKIYLEWDADDLLEFSADERGIQKSFVADFGQGDAMHIIFVDVVPDINDHVIFVFFLRNSFFYGLNEDLGNITAKKIPISRLSFFVCLPCLFKYGSKLLFIVKIIAVDDGAVDGVNMEIGKNGIQNIPKGLILNQCGA